MAMAMATEHEEALAAAIAALRNGEHRFDGVKTRFLTAPGACAHGDLASATIANPTFEITAEAFAAYVHAARDVLNAMQPTWLADSVVLDGERATISGQRRGDPLPVGWGRSLSMPGRRELTYEPHQFVVGLFFTDRGLFHASFTFTYNNFDEEWLALFQEFLRGMARKGYKSYGAVEEDTSPPPFMRLSRAC